MCEEGKLLVTSLLYMKLTLRIPLGHGSVGTNVPFMLGAVVLFVIVTVRASGWLSRCNEQATGESWFDSR